LKRFDFLKWFRGVLLSGEARLLKPDPRFYKLFFQTFSIDPAHAIYVDDLQPNVETATALGMHGILFTDPQALRKELQSIGFIPG
jgi:2-haloacid dehalogenase